MNVSGLAVVKSSAYQQQQQIRKVGASSPGGALPLNTQEKEQLLGMEKYIKCKMTKKEDQENVAES